MSKIKTRGRPPCDDVLTPAEWRVVRAAQHGLSNAAIATKLGISVNAVKFHLANAITKTGVANKKALLQWFGVSKNSALNEERTMTQAHQFEAVGQIARTVSNIEASETWYRDVLGLTHLYTFSSLAFFQIGETRLMLSSESESGSAEPESIIYLMTPNIKTTYESLLGHGVTFSHAPHMIHQHQDGIEEWIAFMLDPDGRPIGLMSKVGLS